MYIKITPDYAGFDKLIELEKKIEDCRAAAKSFAKELGFTTFYDGDGFRTYTGGISAICAPTKPEGYKVAFGGRANDAWFPKETKANKELIERFRALPRVTNDEVNQAVGFIGMQNIGPADRGYGHKVAIRPAIQWCGRAMGYILMIISDNAEFEIKEGMIEVTRTEFKKLDKAYVNA